MGETAQSPRNLRIPTLPTMEETDAAASPAPKFPAPMLLGIWKCHRCGTVVPEPRVRCSACRSWRGGQRKSYSKASSKAHQQRKKKAAEAALDDLANMALQEREATRQRTKAQFEQLLKEKEDTPIGSNKTTPQSTANLHIDEIQVGNADLTSPLTRNSSFESVVTLDTVATASDKVRAGGKADDDDGDGGDSDCCEGEGDRLLDLFGISDPDDVCDFDLEFAETTTQTSMH
jgi:hypothetical protein